MNDAASSAPAGDAGIRIDDNGSVRTITLDRPKALNAFNGPMLDTLLQSLADASGDASVRAVVLTGAGRAFCAGQDLADPSVAPRPDGEPPADVGAVVERWYKPLALRVAGMPVPVVAAVNGVAAGAGANLALCCDIVVAGRSASFIQAFSKIGLVPDCGGTWLLPRLVGRGNALALAMLGEKLGADDAHRLGLVWKVVDDGELQAAAQAIAERLASLPSRALAETRRAIDAAQDMDFAAALANEASLQRTLGASHDYLEGVAAFMAKRAPAFTDR